MPSDARQYPSIGNHTCGYGPDGMCDVCKALPENASHKPSVVGGPTAFGWDCPCGKKSMKRIYESSFEAAYAAAVHVRNPDGPC